MAKHLLHRSKIRPAFEQMGRHGVSQTMRAKVRGVLIETEVGVDDAAHHPRIDPSTTHPQYDGLTRGRSDPLPSSCQPPV